MILKALSLLFSSSLYLIALEVSISSGKDNGADYSVASIGHSGDFMCEKISSQTFQCYINGSTPKKLEPITNKFFSITPIKTAKGTMLSIKTPFESKLFPTGDDLIRGNNLSSIKHRPSKRWQLVSYKESFPLMSQTPIAPTALKFPITFPQVASPIIGPLDVSGKPITVTNDYRDARNFFEVKKAVDSGDFKRAISMIDKALAINPKTLFAGEYGFLKLKSLSLMVPSDPQLVIDSGLGWLKNNAIDDNLPEALIMIGDAYRLQRDEKEATYYYERTTSDFGDTKYGQIALIHQGDMITNGKKIRVAIDFYKQALSTTKDRTTASEAAHKLALKYELTGEFPKMVEFYKKIMTGNNDYYVDHKNEVLKIIKILSDNNGKELASDIGRYVLSKITPKDPLHQELLYTLTLQFEAKGDHLHAKNGFENYLSLYPKGNHVDEAKKKLAHLLLEHNELNATSKMAQYVKVINDYKKGELVDNAKLKKAQLLFEYNKHTDVLAMKQELSSLPAPLKEQGLQLVNKSGQALAIDKLKNNECKESISLIKEFKVVVPSTLDTQLFDCLLATNSIDLAKKISGSYPKKTDQATQLSWMMKHLRILKQEKNHQAIIPLSTDIVTLSKSLNKPKNDPSYEVLYDKFKSYKALNNDNGMVLTLQEIEKIFPIDARTIEPYSDVLLIAVKRSDPLLTQSIAQKLLYAQDRFKMNTYSPWADFILSDLLMKKNDLKGAHKVLNAAIVKNPKPSDKARIYYTQAQIAQKINKHTEAKLFLQKCVSLNDKSSWGNLCKDGFELYAK